MAKRKPAKSGRKAARPEMVPSPPKGPEPDSLKTNKVGLSPAFDGALELTNELIGAYYNMVLQKYVKDGKAIEKLTVPGQGAEDDPIVIDAVQMLAVDLQKVQACVLFLNTLQRLRQDTAIDITLGEGN